MRTRKTLREMVGVGANDLYGCTDPTIIKTAQSDVGTSQTGVWSCADQKAAEAKGYRAFAQMFGDGCNKPYPEWNACSAAAASEDNNTVWWVVGGVLAAAAAGGVTYALTRRK